MTDLLRKYWLAIPVAVIVTLSGCVEVGSTSGGADSVATNDADTTSTSDQTQTQE